MADERVIQKLEHWINKLRRNLFVQESTLGAVGQSRNKEGLEQEKGWR